MPGRSRMAALTLAAIALLAAGPPSRTRADEPAASRKVWIDLVIDGIGPKGCDVEIKPGHASCQFTAPKTRHVVEAKTFIELNDVRTTGADRDCVFAITIREPGQPARTVHRGLRLAKLPPLRAEDEQVLTCYLRTPSKLARAEAEKKTRK